MRRLPRQLPHLPPTPASAHPAPFLPPSFLRPISISAPRPLQFPSFLSRKKKDGPSVISTTGTTSSSAAASPVGSDEELAQAEREASEYRVGQQFARFQPVPVPRRGRRGAPLRIPPKPTDTPALEDLKPADGPSSYAENEGDDQSPAPAPGGGVRYGEYVPATSLDEMKWVGGLDKWWRQDSGNWGPTTSSSNKKKQQNAVRGAAAGEFFAPRIENRSAHPALMAVALQWALVRAVVDGMGREERAGLGITSDAWHPGQFDVETEGVKVVLVRRNGRNTGIGGQKNQLPTKVKAKKLLAGWSKAWLGVGIRDITLKFNICKYLFELSGRPVPDAQLNAVATVGDLLAVVAPRTPPANLLDRLPRALRALPNVRVYRHAPTRTHRDIRTGRWKTIKAEMALRGIPVTRREVLQVPKGMEQAWALGTV